MKIAIVYNEPEPGKTDSLDVLEEVQLVEESCKTLGYEYKTFPFTAHKGAIITLLDGLRRFVPDVVFNLVESVGENTRLLPAVPATFELEGYPYTGSPYDTLLVTTDKCLSKAVLNAHNIPTGKWTKYEGGAIDMPCPAPWIVKPSWEDASVGITDASVFYDEAALRAALPEIYRRHNGQPLLVEQFIDGREFNIAMLEHKDGRIELFPLAEIVFENWPEGKPRILNYNSKWVEDTHEYENTNRYFIDDEDILARVRDVIANTVKAFNIRGYARLDMRMDWNGAFYVMEVNINPCINVEAGYFTAAREAGYKPHEAVNVIIETAYNRSKHG